jgi:hypothetical protein
VTIAMMNPEGEIRISEFAGLQNSRVTTTNGVVWFPEIMVRVI